MSQQKGALVITHSNRAYFAKKLGRLVQEELRLFGLLLNEMLRGKWALT